MELPNMPFILLSLILTVFIPKLVTAQVFDTFQEHSCSDGITYTPNSTYQSNLDAVLHALSTDTRITYGFYNFTAGHEPNRVSSLGLCRGDVPVNTCRLCMQRAATLLPQVCPNNIEAFGYAGYCSLFISNQSIFGQVQDAYQWFYTDSTNISNTQGFNQSLSSLMSSLQLRAASGNSELKYDTGQATFGGGQTLYGLVQCTPDLSRLSCMQCIDESLSELPSCCVQPNKIASGVIYVQQSCFVQYDVKRFFGNVPNMSLVPPPQSPSNISSIPLTGRKLKKPVKASTVAIPAGVSILLFMSIVFVILLRRKKLRNAWMVKFSKDEIEALRSLQYSLRSIKRATHNFSDDLKLGQGGFATVYKGILSDGEDMAVKRLQRSSVQDAEFKNEILILAKLRHRNLVRFLGFCLHKQEMILIYEFVANKSLDNFIFDPLKRQSMLWETRHKIISGIARGILYLHEESRLNIIHRDLKAGNVLLDADFNPKIADFGTARLIDIDHTKTYTSKVVGTLGYMSPEYALQNQVSVKLDVYSFGVLVLEIVSGQKITSFSHEESQESLLSFAWRNWTKGTAWNIVDPVLSIESDTEILRCIHIGLLCIQENPADRPTMSAIDLMLSSSSATLQVPSRPPGLDESNCYSDMLLNWNSISQSASSKSAGGSVNGISMTELHPR